MRLKPNDAEMHNDLGNGLQGVGQLEEATTQYHKAFRLDPDFAGEYNNLGVARQGIKRFQEAVVQYKLAM